MQRVQRIAVVHNAVSFIMTIGTETFDERKDHVAESFYVFFVFCFKADQI
jgi:hypothetical protein